MIVKIQSVKFVGSVPDPDMTMPDDLPHIAFSGRSNVGKSSLVNMLLRRTRSKIAHVSQRPGKTRALNFYRVNDRFYLVDLPGFGYARVPAAERERWKELVEAYLGRYAAPAGVVHLLDVRRGVTGSDRQMLDYLARLGLPTLVVVTKIDKVGRQECLSAMRKVRDGAGLDEEQVLPFSSRTGEGRDALLEALEHLLEGVEVRAGGRSGREAS
jgi:GTP-binding protein